MVIFDKTKNGMKKTLLALAGFACLYSVNAQTNLGFESWGATNPTGWTTSNQIMSIGGPQTVFKDSLNPGIGLYDAKLTVQSCGICAFVGQPDPFPGLILQQHADTMRPINVSFKWHGTVATGDTALIGAAVTLAGGQVGDAYLTQPPTTQATWKTENITFNYYNGSTPDTMTFGAITDQFLYYGHTGTASTSTVIYVDDFVVNGVSGIGLIPTTNDLLFVYPNPANTLLNINLLGTDAYSLDVTDLNGKVVYTQSNLSPKLKLDISSYNNGLYLMRFYNAKKEYLGTTRFTVAN